MNYAELAFSEEIKAIQQRMGSRNTYERIEKASFAEGLTTVETQFISQMDSFYIASFGDNQFPYIQHRGGPKGFMKAIDDQTIGMVDFSGNRQYISVGNIARNSHVSLIFLSYPLKARLKIYAEAQTSEISDHPSLYELLKPQDYTFRPERLMLFHVKAYDWNCPQHITPRYTLAELNKIDQAKDQYIGRLEQELSTLRKKSDPL